MAVDGAGNLFIADSLNDRIRKMDASGTITTVAGTGELGFSGDGGPATSARLSRPNDVAVDGAGNLFIADSGNNRIRKVDATGTISTVAGTGRTGGGDGGPAVQAQLHGPSGVAVDGAGNVFIADRYNYRIRKVDSAGVITTVAGTGVRGSSGDGGPATSARLSGAEGVAVDGAGNVYIASESDSRTTSADERRRRLRGGGRGASAGKRQHAPPILQLPQGGLRWGHHHRGGNGGTRLQRGRRPGDLGPAKRRRGCGGGWRGQCLHPLG